ncbi:diguanylate cyclase [Pseudoalteromonas sp. McH1-7]|uniref:GGDEF domain-containing response regulator n=1 Tax=Pseudoalteromonas TaxID=53246 RepID=UPI00159078C2|nr:MULTISPECIES: diguanylate cyclase [Pseudoalteromonas]MDW7548797.1 diguanylate cyclase [Pseudoalteromonas peptidolytica]NUZ10944.1 diguanylate cyclase [Pseudoalteromonas sp. McH1-7]USD30488.1 diguanylate cyclase [Pseudoalteromonas sp. SCSIO 43201]
MFEEVTELNDCTVVIIEDSPLTQKVLTACLDDMCTVVAFEGAEKAIDYIKLALPDLILMDWMLDGLTGIDACKELQKDPITAQIPVVFVTSNIKENQQEMCWDAGAVDFISKPIVARTLVNRVKTHLKYKKQADQLREYSYVDGLTKAFNRRLFESDLEKHYRGAKRAEHALSVIMLDVDYFKLYNDEYGHLMGDDVLKHVVKSVKSHIRRPMDAVYRYGGEEFVILLPSTPYDSAIKITERIIKHFFDAKIEHKHSPFNYASISAGVATYNAQSHHESAASLVQQADDALYEAKYGGKNKVCGANR